MRRGEGSTKRLCATKERSATIGRMLDPTVRFVRELDPLPGGLRGDLEDVCWAQVRLVPETPTGAEVLIYCPSLEGDWAAALPLLEETLEGVVSVARSRHPDVDPNLFGLPIAFADAVWCTGEEHGQGCSTRLAHNATRTGTRASDCIRVLRRACDIARSRSQAA
jgi:hypothetical protein